MPLRDRKKLWKVIVVVSVAAISALVFIAFPVFFFLYMSYDERAAGPAADKTQYDIEREFQKISPLPLAVPIQHHSMHKTHQGIVSTAYKTERSYGEIRAYYDKELASQGWRFLREADVKYDGQDYGGKELFYCKGDYTGGLQYAGRQEKEFVWTYTFALMWGPSDGCK